MRTPEIEVVRFTQNDVIVASGVNVPQTMTVANWNDGISKNMEITYGNNTYSGVNQNNPLSFYALGDLIRANGQTTDIHTSKDKDTTLTSLVQFERNGNDSGSLSGLDWDADNNYWRTRQ